MTAGDSEKSVEPDRNLDFSHDLPEAVEPKMPEPIEPFEQQGSVALSQSSSTL